MALDTEGECTLRVEALRAATNPDLYPYKHPRPETVIDTANQFYHWLRSGTLPQPGSRKRKESSDHG